MALRVRRAFLVVFLAAVSAGISGCSKSPRLDHMPAGAKILAFGDSLTYGTGASEEESYPAQLAALTGLSVVRAGVPGETSEEALGRLPATLEEHTPALLLLCTGGNDFLRRLGKDGVASNVRKMIRLARDRGIQVVLIGTPEPGFGISPPRFYSEIAAEFRIPYDGATLESVLKDRALKSDLVHPNARGYRIIAQQIAELLRKSGAI